MYNNNPSKTRYIDPETREAKIMRVPYDGDHLDVLEFHRESRNNQAQTDPSDQLYAFIDAKYEGGKS